MSTTAKEKATQKWVKILKDGVKDPSPFEEKCPLDPLPSWFDRNQLIKAQEVSRNTMTVSLAGMAGVPLIMILPGQMFAPLTTGRTTNRAKMFLRNIMTTSTGNKWYDTDLCDPNSPAHKSIVKVRNYHKSLFESIRLMPASERPPGWEMWINQFGMVMVQWSIIGFIFFNPTKVGLHGKDKTREVMEAVNIVWRSVGYLLGMPDDYNLCGESLEETIELCKAIGRDLFRPLLKECKTSFPMGYDMMFDMLATTASPKVMMAYIW